MIACSAARGRVRDRPGEEGAPPDPAERPRFSAFNPFDSSRIQSTVQRNPQAFRKEFLLHLT